MTNHSSVIRFLKSFLALFLVITLLPVQNLSAVVAASREENSDIVVSDEADFEGNYSETYTNVSLDEATISLNSEVKVVDDVTAIEKIKTYQTYTKYNSQTGETYVGRTSGYDSPINNIMKRDANHHMTEKGFGQAILDKTSESYPAIRGREQSLIDYYGGAKSDGGTSGNTIRGIAKSNPKIEEYLEAARKEFGFIE